MIKTYINFERMIWYDNDWSNLFTIWDFINSNTDCKWKLTFCLKPVEQLTWWSGFSTTISVFTSLDGLWLVSGMNKGLVLKQLFFLHCLTVHIHKTNATFGSMFISHKTNVYPHLNLFLYNYACKPSQLLYITNVHFPIWCWWNQI